MEVQHELLSGTPFVTKAQGIFYSPPIPSLEATTVSYAKGLSGFAMTRFPLNVWGQQ